LAQKRNPVGQNFTQSEEILNKKNNEKFGCQFLLLEKVFLNKTSIRGIRM